jgi:hypothetical protein
MQFPKRCVFLVFRIRSMVKVQNPGDSDWPKSLVVCEELEGDYLEQF